MLRPHVGRAALGLCLLLLLLALGSPVAAKKVKRVKTTMDIKGDDVISLRKLLSLVQSEAAAAARLKSSDAAAFAKSAEEAARLRARAEAYLPTVGRKDSSGSAKPVKRKAVLSYTKDLSLYLSSNVTASILRKHKAAISKVYNPAINRPEVCAHYRKMRYLSEEAKRCACDLEQPWPLCESLAFLDLQPRLSKGFSSTASNTKANTGIASYNRTAALKGFACNFHDILRGAVGEFGNAVTGCMSAGCEAPVTVPPSGLVLSIEAEICVPYLEFAVDVIKECAQGGCKPISIADATAETVSKMIDLVERAKGSFSIGLCFSIPVVTDILELVGFDLCFLKGEIAIYPIMTQMEGKLTVQFAVIGAGITGKLQMQDGDSQGICKVFRGTKWTKLYNQYLKCKDYCHLKGGEGSMEFFAFVKFFFWGQKWTLPIVEPATEVPNCDAIFYEHPNYGGQLSKLYKADGDYSSLPGDLKGWQASSVRLAPGCIITVYSQENFQGNSVVLYHDVPKLSDISPSFDNRANSVKVRCTNPIQFDFPEAVMFGSAEGRVCAYDNTDMSCIYAREVPTSRLILTPQDGENIYSIDVAGDQFTGPLRCGANFICDKAPTSDVDDTHKFKILPLGANGPQVNARWNEWGITSNVFALQHVASGQWFTGVRFVPVVKQSDVLVWRQARKVSDFPNLPQHVALRGHRGKFCALVQQPVPNVFGGSVNVMCDLDSPNVPDARFSFGNLGGGLYTLAVYNSAVGQEQYCYLEMVRMGGTTKYALGCNASSPDPAGRSVFAALPIQGRNATALVPRVLWEGDQIYTWLVREKDIRLDKYVTRGVIDKDGPLGLMVSDFWTTEMPASGVFDWQPWSNLPVGGAITLQGGKFGRFCGMEDSIIGWTFTCTQTAPGFAGKFAVRDLGDATFTIYSVFRQKWCSSDLGMRRELFECEADSPEGAQKFRFEVLDDFNVALWIKEGSGNRYCSMNDLSYLPLYCDETNVAKPSALMRFTWAPYRTPTIPPLGSHIVLRGGRSGNYCGLGTAGRLTTVVCDKSSFSNAVKFRLGQGLKAGEVSLTSKFNDRICANDVVFRGSRDLRCGEPRYSAGSQLFALVPAGEGAMFIRSWGTNNTGAWAMTTYCQELTNNVVRCTESTSAGSSESFTWEVVQ